MEHLVERSVCIYRGSLRDLKSCFRLGFTMEGASKAHGRLDVSRAVWSWTPKVFCHQPRVLEPWECRASHRSNPNGVESASTGQLIAGVALVGLEA